MGPACWTGPARITGCARDCYGWCKAATDRAKIAGILRAAGGYYFLYFGAWSVEQLPA
jgi:hypothetical protein